MRFNRIVVASVLCVTPFFSQHGFASQGADSEGTGVLSGELDSGVVDSQTGSRVDTKHLEPSGTWSLATHGIKVRITQELFGSPSDEDEAVDRGERPVEQVENSQNILEPIVDSGVVVNVDSPIQVESAPHDSESLVAKNKVAPVQDFKLDGSQEVQFVEYRSNGAVVEEEGAVAGVSPFGGVLIDLSEFENLTEEPAATLVSSVGNEDPLLIDVPLESLPSEIPAASDNRVRTNIKTATIMPSSPLTGNKDGVRAGGIKPTGSLTTVIPMEAGDFDPMNVIVSWNWDGITVGTAVERIAKYTGYRLVVDPSVGGIYGMQLPQNHRSVSGVNARIGLELLAGPAYAVVINPSNRTVSHMLKPSYVRDVKTALPMCHPETNYALETGLGEGVWLVGGVKCIYK